MDLESTFEKFDGEYLEFERIENPASKRPDLCAFMLLERLTPGGGDMVACVGYDEITLGVDPKNLERVATEDDILTLVRCGVAYDSTDERLWMPV